MNQPQLLRGVVLVAGTLLCASAVTHAQTAVAPNLAALTLPAPVTTERPSMLRQQTGPVQVAVRLADPPLALALGANAKRLGIKMTLAQRQAYVANLKAKQDALMGKISALGGTEVTRLTKAYNALVISADASKLPQIAKLAGVTAVRPIVDHQLSLTSTVPHVGAAALQSLGLTGQGVKIAVLDSGIDYTHRNLGGSGLVSDFNAAAAAAGGVAPANLVPTAKVIGGYDFVGETWPNGPRTPDANPIDAGSGSSHGTHVADIAAGASLDGLHKGVAPGALLYAVKVCSSVSTSCNGTAILQGLEWVMDPRGDLSFADSADVVNLSLGANYGQRENPSTEAVSNVARFGIVVAAAAGNAGDRPYIVSSPSNAAEAISVAQTQMPGARSIPLVINPPSAAAGVYGNTATVDWAPIVAGFTGNVVNAGRGCPANSIAPGNNNPADPLPNVAGLVALIDRGGCSISLKTAYAAAAGATGVLIANNVAGDAPSFSFGGGAPLVQTLVITQAIGTTVKNALNAGPVSVTVSAANGISLAGSMAATSARGPGFNFATIKPEIGAPGASVSAVNGTGSGTGGFGGTSGATPMVAGAAALLLQKFPTATPVDVKARLMNSAEQAVYTNAATQPGVLAPISRIGGGELRVDRAAGANTGLWDATNPYNVGLSFGTVRASGPVTMSKKVAVRNYGATPRTYSIARSFRYANDAANGAVQLNVPASITVPANGTAAFTATMTINASLLPSWNLGSAANQGTGALLQAVEYDGYLTVSDGAESASIPWHVLPHKSHNAVAGTAVALNGTGAGSLNLSNLASPIDAPTDIFALTGTSAKSTNTLPSYGGGQVLIDMKAVGVRPVNVGGPLALQFGIATFGERAHSAYPAEFDIYVDGNNDGIWDAVLYTAENGGFGATGQTLVYAQRLNPDGSANGAAVARFYASADLNSSNMIMTTLASDVGITDASQPFTFMVYSFDNYFTGQPTDIINPMTYTLGTPRYTTALGLGGISVPAGFSGGLPVSAVAGGAAASPSQSGLLLLHGNGKTNRESDVVTVTP